MTALLATICLILIAIIVVQIGKVTELASKIRGEEEVGPNQRAPANYSLFSWCFSYCGFRPLL